MSENANVREKRYRVEEIGNDVLENQNNHIVVGILQKKR